jgi:hypothetical protein
MKKVIGILALLVFAGNIASAELLKNFKYDGKIEVNAYTTNNENDTNSDAKDKTSDVDVRVQLNASFDLTDDVDAVVSAVKCNRQYGNAAGESVAAGTADGFFMEQAYLNLKGVLGLDHKIGRQYYGNAGDLVVYYGPSISLWDTTAGIGSNQLGMIGLDAWTGWYKNDNLDLHAITAKVADGASQPDVDTDLIGVSARYGLMEVLNPSAYIYEQKMTKAAGTADLTMDVIGVKADGKILGFTYKGELAKNYGRQGVGKNYTGTAFLANASYELDVLGKWTFSGEMGIGSGDDKTYAADKDINTFTEIMSDYRPGFIWGGVSGTEGLGNLTTWNLGATWNPEMIEKLTLGGRLYHFSPTVTKINSTAAGAAKTDIGYDTYGNEFDLCANWQHNENVSLKGYYAMMKGDDDFLDMNDDAINNNSNKDDIVTALGVALTVKF